MTTELSHEEADCEYFVVGRSGRYQTLAEFRNGVPAECLSLSSFSQTVNVFDNLRFDWPYAKCSWLAMAFCDTLKMLVRDTEVILPKMS